MSQTVPSPTHHDAHFNKVEVDIAIFGGGIAGLWLINLLEQQGYSCVLLETGQLGGGQTLLSQGIIHGGLKYALGGTLSAESEAIANMPQRWRDCLNGKGELDLRNVEVLSETQHMWSAGSVASKVTSFFASKMIRGRIGKLSRNEYPSILQHPEFKGSVYRLDDLVLNAASLLDALTRQCSDRLLQFDPQQDSLYWNNEGIESIQTGTTRFLPKLSIFAAGTGNEWLLQQARQHHLAEDFRCQRRPLQMVTMKHNSGHKLFAHCVGTSNKPRLTVTSHPTGGSSDEYIWYLGGELAEKGASLSQQELILQARQEMTQLFPWQDFSQAEFSTIHVDRAEPRQDNLLKPDAAFAKQEGKLVICWPTKLTLAPDLGEKVQRLLEENILPPSQQHPVLPDDLPRAHLATPFWKTGPNIQQETNHD